MVERQSRHGDNKLIDEMTQAPSQQSSAGGQLARDVGTRAEEKDLLEGEGIERVTGQDDPARDRLKGDKALSRMQGGG